MTPALSLLGEVAKGSELAFAELYDRFSIDTYSMIRRFVAEPESVDDIMFDVWLHIWKNAPTLIREDAATGALLTSVMLEVIWVRTAMQALAS